MRGFAFFFLLAGATSAATPATQEAQKTDVIVLGVDHAAQLVSPNDSPALLAAFLARAKPDAICIERSPEAFARNDYYEFTYEVQDLVVPLAREKGVALCPIDWEPPAEDARLGFGFDLSTIPEVRPAQGFQQFLSFPRPSQLKRDLFHADNPDNLAKVSQWAVTPAKRANDDLARRLYLYRTYLQAKRLSAAAKSHAGGTVVLIVGEFHKHDIEAILEDDASIRIVQPSAIGRPTDGEIHAADRREYQAAIANFNLLGTQSTTGNMDDAFVEQALQSLEADAVTFETRLLATRLALLRKRMAPEHAIQHYQAIAASAGDAAFTWNGVEDQTRLDSYFDPFGNLNVRQRALVESARELEAIGRHSDVSQVYRTLAAELGPRQQRQLQAYWSRYIAGNAGVEAER